MTAPFAFPVRVYWEDTDAGGVVYYANYFKFMERARTEWLRSLGIEQVPLRDEHKVLFVIRDAESHYHKPARYGDLLHVSCRLTRRTHATFSFAQEIVRVSDSQLLVTGSVRCACVDADTFKPRALPDVLVGQLVDQTT